MEDVQRLIRQTQAAMDILQQSLPLIREKKLFTLQQLMRINLQLQKNAYHIDSNLHQMKQQQSQHDGVMNQKINIKDNSVFLLFGTMTSGKTMVQYYLCQDQLVYGIEESKKLPYIIPENVFNNAQIKKTPSTITTRVPNIRAFRQKKYNKQTQLINESIIFIEVPDIKQLKTQQQSVLILFLQRVFKQCNRLHLLLVIEQQTLCDMGQMMQSCQCITGLFDIKEQRVRYRVSECLSVIVNKVSESSEDSDVKGSLEQVNEQVILQESQQLSEVITKVLKQDRVYMIKNTQPLIQHQRQMLQTVLKHSQFRSFNQIQLSSNLLDEIITNEQTVQQIVQKLQLRKLWQDNIKCLNRYFIFLLTDTKIEANNNIEANNIQTQHQKQKGKDKSQQQVTQQIKSLISSQLLKFETTHPYIKLQNTTSNIQAQLIESGDKSYNIIKKPSQKMLLSIQTLIKTIKTMNIKYMQQQQQLQQQQSTIYYAYVKQLIQALRQIRKLCMRLLLDLSQQINPNYQNLDTQQKDVIYRLVSIKLLSRFIINLQIILSFITQVLDHSVNLSYQIKKQQQQISFNNNYLIQLSKQLLSTIKSTFINFDLTLFEAINNNNKNNNKKNKKKSKHKKNNKQKIIKKPNPTIQQLRQQFINEMKSTKKHVNILDEIISLPISHFKLYLLLEEFKQYKNKIDDNNNNDDDQQYRIITIVIKQIASILHFYTLFVQQILFLLVIPDWNRITIAVETIERRQQKVVLNQADQKQIEILNKLAIQAKHQRLNKLSLKIFKVVDNFLHTNQMIKSGLDPKPYINERQNHGQLNQNWFYSYLQEEINSQNAQQKRPFLPLVDKAKKYEQQNKQKINKYNQQMYLMKQRFK